LVPEQSSWLRGAVAVFGVAVFFLGFAALVSWMAPTYALTVTRLADGSAAASVTRYILFVVPVSTLTQASFDHLAVRVDQPPQSRIEDPQSRSITPEQVGTLTMSGDGEPLEVMVAPSHLFDVERSIKAVLAGKQTDARFYLVANWLVAVYVPAIVAFPGLLLIAAGLWDQLRPSLGGLRRKRHRRR
jgi:hypothetical protein